jgi:hypothetical protein
LIITKKIEISTIDIAESDGAVDFKKRFKLSLEKRLATVTNFRDVHLNDKRYWGTIELNCRDEAGS